jgi:hypothetical protein
LKGKQSIHRILVFYPVLFSALVLMTTTTVFSASGSGFKNGTHLINRDNHSYTITFDDIILSTKICFCEKPTRTMKNGITQLLLRGKVKGIRIVSKKEKSPDLVTITAVVESGAKISCLSAWPTTVTVDSIGSIDCPAGKTVVIGNGRLSVQ